MILKEAFQYQNYLDKLLNMATEYLDNDSFLTTTKQTHKKSKADKDAADETIVVQKPQGINFSPSDVIDFIMEVLQEKETVGFAITKAKRNTKFDIDQTISMNKKKQIFISHLIKMANMKSMEKKSTGIGYRLNVAGDQTKYYYDVEEITSIDFNRGNVKALVKKLTKDTEKVSAELDRIMILTEVDVVPKWDITDTLEDLIELMSKQSAE